MSESAISFSILIVTWNGDDLLLDCLKSIESVYGNAPEIIVVDNADQTSTRRIVESYRNAKYASSRENLGFAGGNNLGWPLVSNEYVVLLNNDTRLQGDSISPLIAYMDQHPECAAAQGTIVFEAYPDKTDGTGLWLSPIGILAPEGSLTPLSDSPKFPREVFAVGGAFFAVRRSAVENAGGLFYDHFKSYYEEIDLCHRLWLVGYRCAYVPTISVLHRHNATSRKLERNQVLQQYYRNIWFSALTCYGWYGLVRFVPSLLVLCIGQSVGALLRGRSEVLKMHCKNMRILWQERKLIAETRDNVRKGAVVSDWNLFRHAVRRQTWRYYWGLVKRG